MNLLRFVTLRPVLNRPWSTLLALLGVAVGITLFLSIRLINVAVLGAFQESLAAVSGQATLMVSAGEAGLAEEVAERLEKIEGVRFSVPVVESRAFLYTGKGTSEPVMVLGVDMLRERNVRSYRTSEEEAIEDPLIFLNHADSLVLPKPFAARHGFQEDSTLELSTTDGAKRFTVRGLLTPVGPAKAYGGAVAFMDISGAQVTFGKSGKVDRVDLVTDPDTDPELVAARIRKELGPGVKVERPLSRGEQMERMTQAYRTMLQFFSTLALLVGLYLVSCGVQRSVAERRREIGTFRALGATRFSMVSVFVLQGAMEGFMGSVIGVFASLPLARSMIGSIATAMEEQVDAAVRVTRVAFEPREVFLAILLGTFASAAAAFIPARKAADIQPVEAMQWQDQDLATAETPQRRHSVILGMILWVTGLLLLSNGTRFTSTSQLLLTQVSAFLGVVLIAPWIVTTALSLASSRISWRLGNGLRLVLGNLVGSPKRTGQNVIVVVSGVLLSVLTLSAIHSYRSSIRDWVSRPIFWEISVISECDFLTFGTQALREDVGRDLIGLQDVEIPPGGRATAARMIRSTYAGEPIQLEAYDDPLIPEAYPILFHSSDDGIGEKVKRIFASDDGVSVLVSTGFVRKFGRHEGEIIRIPAPEGEFPARIAGVVDDFSYAGGTIYMNREIYRRRWKDDLVNVFGVRLKPGASVERVRQEIDSRFARSRRLMAIRNSELKREILREVDRSFSFTRAFELLTFLVVGLSLFNTALVGVIERRREIGLLRAVGISREGLLSLFSAEYVIQGLLASLIALALVVPIAYFWVKSVMSGVLGWDLRFELPLWSVTGTVLMGTLVPLITGFVPAWQTVRLEIRKVLDHE